MAKVPRPQPRPYQWAVYYQGAVNYVCIVPAHYAEVNIILYPISTQFSPPPYHLSYTTEKPLQRPFRGLRSGVFTMFYWYCMTLFIFQNDPRTL